MIDNNFLSKSILFTYFEAVIVKNLNRQWLDYMVVLYTILKFLKTGVLWTSSPSITKYLALNNVSRDMYILRVWLMNSTPLISRALMKFIFLHTSSKSHKFDFRLIQFVFGTLFQIHISTVSNWYMSFIRRAFTSIHNDVTDRCFRKRFYCFMLIG